MKNLIIILLSIFLTGCLCPKHTGAIVKDKIQGKKYKIMEYTDDKLIHTFNYIILTEKDSSITMKKMSKFRLKHYHINEPLCKK